MSPPIGVHRHIYNEEERNIIDPFKEDYMKTTSPSERKAIAQAHIFPALFTYWSSIGVDLNPVEMKSRSNVSFLFLENTFYSNYRGVTEPFKLVEECLACKKNSKTDARDSLSADGYSMVDSAGGCFQRNCFNIGPRNR